MQQINQKWQNVRSSTPTRSGIHKRRKRLIYCSKFHRKGYHSHRKGYHSTVRGTISTVWGTNFHRAGYHFHRKGYHFTVQGTTLTVKGTTFTVRGTTIWPNIDGKILQWRRTIYAAIQSTPDLRSWVGWQGGEKSGLSKIFKNKNQKTWIKAKD